MSTLAPLRFSRTCSRTYALGGLHALPPDYEARADWPLVLFLHGSGERGTDPSVLTRHGLPRRLAEGATFPFVVLAPQCSGPHWWDQDPLVALLDDALERYAVDPLRVYLTGLSMGGYAAWALATRYPERFAALVPVCGGGQPLLAPHLRDVPTWAFHGARDEVVPVGESDRMVAALEAAGGDVRYTRYADEGHDSWTRAYATDELYVWMLAQRRAQ